MSLFCCLYETWTGFLLTLNAILGAIFLRYIWRSTKRHRQPNHILEKNALSMYRRDTKRWDYFKLLFGAVTFGLPRFILVWTCILSCLIGVR